MLALIAALATGCQCCSIASRTPTAALRQALTFHASFDHGPDADFAKGDPRIYTAPGYDQRYGAPAGLNASNVTFLARGEGRLGGALRFTRRQAPLVFFQAAENMPYNPTNWSGTISFWLKTDPASELEPGFCDPIQITPRAWNDGAFFVEFEKRKDVPFRLGVYADYKVWNPANRKWEELAMADKPLLTIAQPPFGPNKWTHVVITFDHFNTGAADGIARLYLDGTFQGALSPRTQTFTWSPGKALVLLGQAYIGRFDELSFYSRALNDLEIRTLHELPHGVASLHPAPAR